MDISTHVGTTSGKVDEVLLTASVDLPDQTTFDNFLADLANADPVTVTITCDDADNVTAFNWTPHTTAKARLALSRDFALNIAEQVQALEKQLADLQELSA